MDGVAILHPNRRIAYANSAFAEICGLSVRACLGQDLESIFRFHSEGPTPPWKNLERVTSPSLYAMGKLTVGESETKTVQVSVQPLATKNQSPYFLMYVRDSSLETRLHKKYRTEMNKSETLASKLNGRLIEAVLYNNVPEKLAQETSSEELLQKVVKNAVNVFGLKGLAVIDTKGSPVEVASSVCVGAKDFPTENVKVGLEDFWRRHRDRLCPAVEQAQVYEVQLGNGLRVTCWPIEQNDRVSQVMVVLRGIDNRRKFENDDALLGRLATQIQRHISYQGLEDNSVVDVPTQLHNARSLQSRLNVELEIARKSKSPMCILLFEIDHFGELSRRLGRVAADEALNAVGQTTRTACRDSDIIARLDGGQFAVALLETAAGGATVIAERIRVSVEELAVTYGGRKFRVTVSLGISAFPDQASNREELFNKAKIALAKAQGQGRNKIQLYFLGQEAEPPVEATSRARKRA